VRVFTHPIFQTHFHTNADCLFSSLFSLSSLPPFLTHCVDIFDGDELTNADMNVDVDETARYSCHVVGLVLSASHNAFVADPNGALVQGGNMEFLSLPLTPSNVKPTTKMSCFDRDQVCQKS
jgi:hypothetical protein